DLTASTDHRDGPGEEFAIDTVMPPDAILDFVVAIVRRLCFSCNGFAPALGQMFAVLRMNGLHPAPSFVLRGTLAGERLPGWLLVNDFPGDIGPPGDLRR